MTRHDIAVMAICFVCGILLTFGLHGLLWHNKPEVIVPNTATEQYQIDTLLSARKQSDFKVHQLEDSIKQKEADEKLIYKHFMRQYAKIKTFNDSDVVRFRDSILSVYKIK
jgi:hypothetical protein